MLMQSNFTRREAFLRGLIEDVSRDFDEFGIECGVAISSAAMDKIVEAAEDRHVPNSLRDVAWGFRLHETGKLQPLDEALDEDGKSMTFRAFLNRDGDPVEIALKGKRGRGDFGEPVLTVMLPEEEFVFTGKLVSLRAEYVAALAPFVSPDAPMNVLRVEPAPSGGVFLVAMGHNAMGVFHDPDAYTDEPMLLRISKELARNCKSKYGDRGPRRVVIDGERASVEDASGNTYYLEPLPVLETGTFPGWRPILDKAVSAAESSGGAVPSPLYKADSMRLFEFQGQREGLRIYPTGAESPVVVRSEAYPSFVGLVMPLHDAVDEAMSPRPEWMESEFESLDRLPAMIEQSMAAPIQ